MLRQFPKSVRCLGLFTELVNPDRKGGILVFNQFLIRALANVGVSLHSLTEFDRPEDSASDNGAVRPCGAGRWGRIRMLLASVALAIRWRPHFILCGHIAYSPVALMLKWLTGRPVVVICHGTEAWSLGNRRPFVARADLVLAVSRFTSDAVARQLPKFPRDRIRLLPNTYDDSRFFPQPSPPDLRSKLEFAATDPVLLTVCRLDPLGRSKGYDAVLKALPALRRQFPGIRYVLAGRGPDLNRVRQVVTELGLDDAVRLVGFVSDADLPRYYALCSIFIMPSNQEGFGIVFLEALASGRPVIAGDGDGSAEPLLGGRLGLMVDPGNPDTVVDAVTKILSGRAPAHFYEPEELRRQTDCNFGRQRFQETVLEALRDVIPIGPTAPLVPPTLLAADPASDADTTRSPA